MCEHLAIARQRVTFRQALKVTSRQWDGGRGSENDPILAGPLFLLHALWYRIAGIPVRDPEG